MDNLWPLAESICLTLPDVEHLAMHRGEVVTRTALYEHLFEDDEEPFSNIVDVYIARIRKKLTRDLIVTRHGHGYCIETGP